MVTSMISGVSVITSIISSISARTSIINIRVLTSTTAGTELQQRQG